jgi:hypothetical protein
MDPVDRVVNIAVVGDRQCVDEHEVRPVYVGDLVAVAQLGDGEVNGVARAGIAHEDPPSSATVTPLGIWVGKTCTSSALPTDRTVGS